MAMTESEVIVAANARGFSIQNQRGSKVPGRVAKAGNRLVATGTSGDGYPLQYEISFALAEDLATGVVARVLV